MWSRRSERMLVVLLTKTRFVWSFLSHCSDRLELWCHELSLESSSELRGILRPSTINSQTEWSEERGRWVEGEAAYCINALLGFWNCTNPPSPHSPSFSVILHLSVFVLEMLWLMVCLAPRASITTYVCIQPGALLPSQKALRRCWLVIYLFLLRNTFPEMCHVCTLHLSPGRN